MPIVWDPVVRLATAALIGLAVGLEREWSGHASGPHARFAGLRTFFLLGLLGGIAGSLIAGSHDAVGVVLLAAGGALTVVAYGSAVRRDGKDLDGTTEVAALIVLALGAFAMLGNLLLAAAAAAVVVLLLGEKKRLHWVVRKITAEELEAALQFAVLALVVLPLLPTGPFGGILDIRPRAVWAIVLLFSGLNFLGYVARRAVGAERGYGVTGLLGGVISSTAVTLQFSRFSRRDASLSVALGLGVIGACTVLFPRVLILSAAMAPAISLALLPRIAIPAVLGMGLFLFVALRKDDTSSATQPMHQEHQSPLRLAASMQMAAIFQLSMSVIAIIRGTLGTPGLYAGAALLGLTDVDALTVSICRSGAPAIAGAQAIAIGIMANTVLKLGIGLAFGSASFRRLVGPGLALLAVGGGVGMWIWWSAAAA